MFWRQVYNGQPWWMARVVCWFKGHEYSGNDPYPGEQCYMCLKMRGFK